MVRSGRTLTAYVHRDASPGNVGLQTLRFAAAHLPLIDVVAEQFFALTAVDPRKHPTPEQLAQLKSHLSGLPSPRPQGGIRAMEFETAALAALRITTPDASGRDDVEELRTWNDLGDLAHGDLGVFLQAGFLPVLSNEPVSEGTLPPDLEWGYLINVDSREVEAYCLLAYAGMSPGTWRISFDDLAPLDPTELTALTNDIQELEDGDNPDRELAEMNAMRAALEEAREEARQEREEKERRGQG